jgi:hypothetical protein
VRQRRVRQIELFETNHPPLVIPPAIEQEAFDLLVQLVQAMIPLVETEVRDEQDHG